MIPNTLEMLVEAGRNPPPDRHHGSEPALGVLLIDNLEPNVPGDVAHPSTFRPPVLYEMVEGCTVERLVFEADASLESDVVSAARMLRDRGAALLTSNCGFLLAFQPAVASEVNVPVALSSLSQLPAMEAVLPRKASIGILTASARSLTPDLLRSTGIDDPERFAIAGLERSPEFRAAFLEQRGWLDPRVLEQEVLRVATDLMAENDCQALLLECSVLPPFAARLARELRRPVFDYLTLVESLRRTLQPPSFGEAGVD